MLSKAVRSSIDDVIEVYKRDIDRTLLRENLTLSPEERIRKVAAVVRGLEDLRRAGRRPR